MDQVTELFDDPIKIFLGVTAVSVAGVVLYQQLNKKAPAKAAVPFSDAELEEESRKAKKAAPAAPKAKKGSKGSKVDASRQKEEEAARAAAKKRAEEEEERQRAEEEEERAAAALRAEEEKKAAAAAAASKKGGKKGGKDEQKAAPAKAAASAAKAAQAAAPAPAKAAAPAAKAAAPAPAKAGQKAQKAPKDVEESGEWETVEKKQPVKKVTAAAVETTKEKDGSVTIAIGTDYGLFIGKGGSIMKKLESDTGARFDLLKDEGNVRISGSESAIKAAVAEVQKILDREEAIKANTVTSTLSYSKDNVKAVIGKGGATIRDIQIKSGAKVDVNVDEGTVTITGSKEAVDLANTLAKNAMFGETQVVMELGSRGAVKVVQGDEFKTIRQLQDQFSVRLDILKGTTQLKLAGAKEAVVNAQKAVHDLLATNRGVEMEIDNAKVGAVYGKAGANIRSIQETTGANIEVDKNRSPALITIMGAPEAVSAARARIQQVIDGETELKPGEVQQSLELGTATPAIIGAKGAKVSELEQKFGVRINVNSNTSLCNVTGKPELVRDAVAAIEEIAKPIQEKNAAQAAANKALTEGTASTWQEVNGAESWDASIAVGGETGW